MAKEGVRYGVKQSSLNSSALGNPNDFGPPNELS